MQSDVRLTQSDMSNSIKLGHLAAKALMSAKGKINFNLFDVGNVANKTYESRLMISDIQQYLNEVNCLEHIQEIVQYFQYSMTSTRH